MDLLAINNTFSPWHEMFISILLSFLAIFGFLGNLTVCIVFGRGKDLSQSSVNILIFNPAKADMLQYINLVFMITAISRVT